MSDYLTSIISACSVFIVVAFIITIPYIIFQYHKYGSFFSLRILIVYSFILYLLVTYFLIILPLPTINEVNAMTGPYAQLIPFKFIYDIVTEVKLDWSLFKAKQIYQVFFNFLLTVPFGMYLKYYFKQDLKHTILYTFLLSLFFELTQLSGLYFIYPRPYRLFDIDDLMINTLGGVAGYHLISLFTFLPTRDEIDKVAYEKGNKVSFFRYFMGFCLDCFFIILVSTIIYFIYNEIPFLLNVLISIVLLFILMPIITKGYTIGKKIVNIKLVSLNNNNCKWYQYIIRYLLLFIMIVIIPLLGMHSFVNLSAIGLTKQSLLIIGVVILVILLIIFFYILIHNILNKDLFIFEKISKTKNISTIKMKK